MRAGQRGFLKVFAFTFARQTQAKGYLIGTITAVLLCFLTPLAIMTAVEFFTGASQEETPTASPEAGISGTAMEAPLPGVGTIYLADETAGEEAQILALAQSLPQLAQVNFVSCEDYAAAAAMAEGTSDALIAVLTEGEEGLSLELVLPEGTAVSRSAAQTAGAYLTTTLWQQQIQKSGISQEAADALLAPVTRKTQTAGAQELDEGKSMLEMMREILVYLLPMLNCMVLYFLILLYGQSVAGSVIMEKSSKLMDTFLVSVKPTALVFGKVTAVALASAIQFVLAAVALIGGFAAGSAAVRAMNPDSQMGILLFFDSLSLFEGMFSAPGIVLALLLVAGGFFLYCSLAAIGGSVAGKPEDLSSTNMLFALVLVASFLAALYMGGLESGQGFAAWLDYVPFTAVLVTPSRVLVGSLSPGLGLVSLAIVLASSGLCLALAGKVYRMMALYRGNPPGPAMLLRMMKSAGK